VVLDRLTRREARGADPSDAGPAFYPESVARFEAPTEWPADALHVVHTDRDGWKQALRALAADLS
jgi:hypothetical protein